MSTENASSPALSHRPLPTGTRLRNFVVSRYLGEGGFGIVYVATDELLQREVAIKEYLPATLATRGEDNTVVPLSAHERETFSAGLAGFLEEARLLARFDHPNLVKVLDFWEANGTAYMAMPYYRGVTLRNVLRQKFDSPDEAWLKALLRPLCDALGEIHAQQCVHRDISPDNILMLGSGQPLLLDFGAARRVIADATQDLTVILKPGFAPIEQYGDSATARQGPWSDVYALAAVVYFAITKTVPKAAVARIIKDDLLHFVDVGRDRYGTPFLEGLDRALAVRPEARPATIEAFAASIGLERSLPAPDQAAPATTPAAPGPEPRAHMGPAITNNEATVVLPRTESPVPVTAPTSITLAAPRSRPVWPLVAVVGVLAAATIAGIEMFDDAKPRVRTPSAATPSVTSPPAPTTSSETPGAAQGESVSPPKAEPPASANIEPPATVPPPPATSVLPPAQPAPSPVPRAKTAEPSRANLPVSRSTAASAKCGDWLARLQLGETLTEQEMALFSRECRK